MDSQATSHGSPLSDFEAEPFDENSGGDLLSLIEAGEIIPIAGPELVEIDALNGPELFHALGGAGARRQFQALAGGTTAPELTLNGGISNPESSLFSIAGIPHGDNVRRMVLARLLFLGRGLHSVRFALNSVKANGVST